MLNLRLPTVGTTMLALSVGLMSLMPSLEAKSKKGDKCDFTPCKPVQINGNTDYLFPIRDNFYNALFTSNVNGVCSFISADFNPNNRVVFNTWFGGAIRVNPTNPNNLVTLVGHDNISLVDPHFVQPGIDVVVGFSTDGGKSWGTTVVPLSTWQTPTGNIAQGTAANDLRFDSEGNLFLVGLGNQTVVNTNQENIEYFTSFLTQPANLTANPLSNDQFLDQQVSPLVVGTPSKFPDVANVGTSINPIQLFSNTGAPANFQTKIPCLTNQGNPAEIVFLVKSTDGGQSFGTPVIVDATQSAAFIFTGFGLSPSSPFLFVGSSGKQLINSTRIDNLNTLFSYLYTANSSNGGANWSTQISATSINASSPVYTLFNDSTFQSLVSVDNKYFKKFPNGGEPVAGNIVETGSNLLMPMLRLYPLPLGTQFDDTPNTTAVDRAVVFSTDGGSTWSQNAVQVSSTVFSSNHNPHTTLPELEGFGLIIVDGALNSISTVSPKTGRVYLLGQGGNGVVSDSPAVNQFFPVIQVSVSNDDGNSWSTAFNASQTPINLANLGAAQSFNGNIAVTQDGFVGVVYTDYRFFQPTDPLDLVKADVWLAIYKELPGATDGPFGNGLEFVKEVRLTPNSFNAANASSILVPGLTGAITNLGNFTGLDVSGNDFLVSFTQAGGSPDQSLISPNPSFGNISEDTNNHSNSWFVRVQGPKS